MSLTLNMVGGGGGGLKATDALLRVQAPAGSTVTITKGTTTKTDLGHENADDHTVYDYYFIIHQSQFDSVNPWTVTATLGSDSTSDTIIIDTADEYNIVMRGLLPSDYTVVSYLETTGTQRVWINLGSSKNLNALKFDADLMLLTQSNATSFISDSQSSPVFAFIRIASGIYPTMDTVGNPTGTKDDTLYNKKVNYVYEGTNGTINIYKDGVQWYTGTRSTRNMQQLIMPAHYNGSSVAYCKVRIYGVKVYDTDHTTLLADYYPCYRKADSVAGFYDKVTSSFITNSGTGTFVVGE